VLAPAVIHIFFDLSIFIFSNSEADCIKITSLPAFSQIFTSSFVFELFFHQITISKSTLSNSFFKALCLSNVALQISEFQILFISGYFCLIFSIKSRIYL
jgi:hypothetical protein